MRKVSYIVIAALMWCASIAYVVVAGRYAAERRAAIAVKNIDIRVADEGRVRVATTDSVRGWLAESGLGILGRPVDEVDTRAIERFVERKDGIRGVRAHTDLSGNLRVKVWQRVPLVKVETSSGGRFWVTRDGWILPWNERFSAPDTLPVRGDIPTPFDPARGVEYAALERANFEGFVEEFTALHAEHQRLTAERIQIRGALSAAGRSGPKRFWGRTRRAGFEHQKIERIETLTGELLAVEAALEKNRETIASTRENEKKTRENLAFLPKLANFVEFVVDSDFWSTKIARIDVRGDELIIIPAGGDHTVIFGALDGSEARKLSKLEAFYRTGEATRFRIIDVKYEDQIICRVN